MIEAARSMPGRGPGAQSDGKNGPSPGRVDERRRLGAPRKQRLREGGAVGLSGKASQGGRAPAGIQGRQYFWKIVFKIICSGRKRQESPGIGEALVRISRGA